MPREGYPDESDSDSHDNRRSHVKQRHSEGGDIIMTEVEGYQTENLLMMVDP